MISKKNKTKSEEVLKNLELDEKLAEAEHKKETELLKEGLRSARQEAKDLVDKKPTVVAAPYYYSDRCPFCYRRSAIHYCPVHSYW